MICVWRQFVFLVAGPILLKTLILSCLVVIFASCTLPSSDFAEEQERVIEFRRRVSERRYEMIYDDASVAFKKATDRTEFIRGLEKVASQISRAEEFELTNRSINVNPSSVLYVLVFRKKDEGIISGDEFVFVKVNSVLRLYNYRYQYREERRELN